MESKKHLQRHATQSFNQAMNRMRNYINVKTQYIMNASYQHAPVMASRYESHSK
jgi:hypothetical protein